MFIFVSPINDAKQKILNLNFANTAVFRGVLPAMLEASKSIISRVVIPLPAARERMAKNLALSQYRGSAQQYVDDPVSFLAFPVFDTLQEDRQLAGVLATNVYWKLFLTGILPQSAMGYYCTLTNSFNQTLAYRVDGPDVTYLGEGDFHDTRYDHLEAVADINTYIGQRARPETRSYTSVPLNTEIGKYQLHVYPTQETEDCFISNRPSIYATIVASIFLFNALVFLLFVWFVERRQRIVMDRVIQTAEKSASQERELNLFLAHEVRNPLSAALAAHSFVASAVKETISEPVENNGSLGTLEDDVAVIGSSLCFIDDFLRSMLDMNRAVANKLVVKLAPADLLKDVLEPVCNILSHRGFGVNVLVDCPQNLIVNTDALRLKQVLLNLGRNSAKFVNSGFIRFRAAVVQGNVEVYVEDSGPGIPLQKRGNLFQKFQSSLDVLSQGTGIGLSLCKSLIDLLQGEIWLDDTYDSGVQDTPGARFVIQLFSPPLSPGALLSSVETASSRNSVGVDMLSTPREMEVDSSVEKPSAELPEKLSVLFVDDDIVLRKLFVRSLRTVAPAWAIEEAANGETALQLTETEQFDLIFMVCTLTKHYSVPYGRIPPTISHLLHRRTSTWQVPRSNYWVRKLFEL